MTAAWLNNIVHRFTGRSASGAASGAHAAVYLSGSMVATVLADVSDNLRIAMRADPMPNMTDLRDLVAAQAEQIGVLKSRAKNRVNLVLAPELYHLCTVERPDVPDSEVDEAVRWTLQEQVDYAVDTASLVTFPLPASASRDRRMVFAAIMPTEFLRGIVQQIHDARLELASIDISELALRNLAWHCFPQADQSVALLRLTANSGVINVSRGDELYLARRVSGVPKTFSEDGWSDFRERLLLQVQRSIDYYESAMSQPPCNMLMVACTDDWTQRVCGHLSELLPIPVRTIGEALSGELALTLYNPEREDVDWEHLDPRQMNAVAAAVPALGGVLRARIDAADEANAA